MELRLKDTNGKDKGVIEVRKDVFDVPANPALVHQVMVGQRANMRQGTAATKTRTQVSGGGRKPWPQKHTGRRARRLDPRTSMEGWWRRVRTDAQELSPAHAQADAAPSDAQRFIRQS